ncbi:MAG: hypothetical protein ACFFBD_19720 [Candidatus Hodarchaeota archaeon]
MIKLFPQEHRSTQTNFLEQLETHLRVIQVQLANLKTQLNSIDLKRYLFIVYEMVGVDEEGLLIETTILKNWPGIQNRSSLASLLQFLFPLGTLLIDSAWTTEQLKDISLIPLPNSQIPATDALLKDDVLVRLLYRDSKLAVAEIPLNYTLHNLKIHRPLIYMVPSEVSMISLFGIVKELPRPEVLKNIKSIFRVFLQRFEEKSCDTIKVPVKI